MSVRKRSAVSFRSRQRSKAAVASVILASVALAACSSNDDDGDGNTDDDMEPTASGAPAGSFAVVRNDGMAPGSVSFFTPDLETLDRTLATGANEGIAFGPDGALYQNGDSEGGFVGIRRFADVASRPDMDGFGDSDSVIGSAPGKGLSFIAGTSLLASCDVTDEAADLKFFAVDDASGDAASPALSVDLASSCWDTFHDAGNDRLYVALTNGTLAIFDELSVELGEPAEGADTDLLADRNLTPVDATGAATSVNLHGVFAENGSVLVSDVGDAMSADDGRLFVFADDGAIDGDVETQSVGGPATLLGNPVDVVLLNGNAIVAEKSNDALLVFNDVANAAGDQVPDYMQEFTKPESIELVPGQ